MNATVEVLYEGKPPTRLVVKVKDGLKRTRLLDAIDRQVEEHAAAGWHRWNLVNVMNVKK